MADPYWFVPRRFGYGATPVIWQGWSLRVAQAAPLLINSVWWRIRRGVFGGAVVLAGLGQDERAVAVPVLTQAMIMPAA